MGKQCNAQAEKSFKEWNGLSIVCPDWDSMGDDAKKSFNLYGDPSRMKQETMIFNIQKCSDELDIDPNP